VASLCSVALNVLVLTYLDWGLVGTALAVSLPLTVLNVVDIPVLISRRVGLTVGRYFLSVMVRPLLHTLPFTLSLVGARLLYHDRPLTGLALGGGVGAVILVVIYWQYVLPDQIKERVSRCVGVGRKVTDALS
jgi:hypothetical protein